MSDKVIELTMVCTECSHVVETSFRYDSACGELIALYPDGENCAGCGSINLEEVQ